MNAKEVFKLIPQKWENSNELLKVQETPILSVYKKNEGYIREFTSIYTNKKYAWLDEDENIVYYDDVQQKKVLTHMFCIMELIGIEHTLCKHKTFMLHSSYTTMEMQFYSLDQVELENQHKQIYGKNMRVQR